MPIRSFKPPSRQVLISQQNPGRIFSLDTYLRHATTTQKLALHHTLPHQPSLLTNTHCPSHHSPPHASKRQQRHPPKHTQRTLPSRENNTHHDTPPPSLRTKRIIRRKGSETRYFHLAIYWGDTRYSFDQPRKYGFAITNRIWRRDWKFNCDANSTKDPRSPRLIQLRPKSRPRDGDRDRRRQERQRSAIHQRLPRCWRET